jgi:dihydropyrimidinase
MKTIIKNGTIVTAEASFKADVLIDGEVISQIAEEITAVDAQIIDAAGKLVLPGGVDPHVHLHLKWLAPFLQMTITPAEKQLPSAVQRP